MAARPLIFLANGLGGTALAMAPLAWILQWWGGYEVCVVRYKSWSGLANGINTVTKTVLTELKERKRTQCILIGHSMGGVVMAGVAERLMAARVDEPDQAQVEVCGLYPIASPLRGCFIASALVRWFGDYRWFPEVLCELAATDKEPPTGCPYATISASYGPAESGTSDGRVFREEATWSPAHHTHIPWSGHSLMKYDPRMWKALLGALRKQE